MQQLPDDLTLWKLSTVSVEGTTPYITGYNSLAHDPNRHSTLQEFSELGEEFEVRFTGKIIQAYESKDQPAFVECIINSVEHPEQQFTKYLQITTSGDRVPLYQADEDEQLVHHYDYTIDPSQIDIKELIQSDTGEYLLKVEVGDISKSAFIKILSNLEA